MNGHFEYNKGAYPFTATRIGERWDVLYTPMLETILKDVPQEVGVQIALKLNATYHANKSDGKNFRMSDAEVVQLASATARDMFERDEITATEFQHVLNSAKDIG